MSDAQKFTHAIKFTISLIYCGFAISDSQVFAILNDQTPPDRYYINKAFSLLRPLLKKLAEESAKKHREKMKENSAICVDGSWDHKRDGKMLVFDVICVESHKIIDFVIKIRRTTRKNGNTDVSAQGLEGDAFLEVLPRLMANDKISEVVKDGDLQVDSIIRMHRWNIRVIPDPNHLLIHFNDIFDIYQTNWLEATRKSLEAFVRNYLSN